MWATVWLRSFVLSTGDSPTHSIRLSKHRKEFESSDRSASIFKATLEGILQSSSNVFWLLPVDYGNLLEEWPKVHSVGLHCMVSNTFHTQSRSTLSTLRILLQRFPGHCRRCTIRKISEDFQDLLFPNVFQSIFPIVVFFATFHFFGHFKVTIIFKLYIYPFENVFLILMKKEIDFAMESEQRSQV